MTANTVITNTVIADYTYLQSLDIRNFQTGFFFLISVRSHIVYQLNSLIYIPTLPLMI